MNSQEILHAFREVGVDLQPAWLDQILEARSETRTLDHVYRCLIHSDLRESMKSPTRGSEISKAFSKSPSSFPDGHYLCQISEALDISIPSSKRYIRESSSCRVFKFKLHCGPMELVAIELVHIKQIPNDVDIGSKIILTGAPIIQDGIMLLQAENVSIIGGEIHKLNQEFNDLIKAKLKLADPLEYVPQSRHIRS